MKVARAIAPAMFLALGACQEAAQHDNRIAVVSAPHAVVIAASVETSHPTQPAGLRLIGIARQGGESIALLSAGAGARHFRIGELVADDWKLSAIGSEWVELVVGPHHMKLALEPGPAPTFSPVVKAAQHTEAPTSPAPIPLAAIPSVTPEEAADRNRGFKEAMQKRFGSATAGHRP